MPNVSEEEDQVRWDHAGMFVLRDAQRRVYLYPATQDSRNPQEVCRHDLDSLDHALMVYQAQSTSKGSKSD